MTGPIFVSGASRSGKTLMRGILSSHSRIVVSRRTDMWPRFYERFGDLDQRENFERCLDEMLERPQIAALDPDIDRVRREFGRGPRTYPRLFALIHEHYAERCGKPRWGDQTAGLERMADTVIPAYPGTRFIHMLRDPRDRYAALVARRPQRRFALERSTIAWVRSAVLAARNSARHPDVYCAVRYEVLVSRPEQTIRNLCTFLHEKFEPAMLRMENEPRYDEARRASSVGIPLTTAYIGCHRDVLDRRSSAFVRLVARPEMRRLGYLNLPSHATPGGKS